MRNTPAHTPDIPIFGSPVAVAVTLLIAVVSVMPANFSGNTGALPSSLGLAPHLALAPIFVWLVQRDGVVGPVGAFLAGLAVDALTSCPLGVLAASYLAFHFVAGREAPVLRELPFLARLGAFALLAGGVTAVQIAAVVTLGGIRPSLGGIGLSMLATIIAYPIAAAVIRPARQRSAIRSLGR